MSGKHYKARGIVLHTVKYGDNSIIAYLLTDIHGRMTYMIQGVHSHRGRGNKSALFQPMFLLEFEGVESSRSQMHRMKEVHSMFALHSIPFDVRKTTVSLFMAETLYRLVKEVEPNAPLFDFIYKSVMLLDDMKEGIANFHLWFLVHLSSHMGFHPGNEYSPDFCFDIRNGVFCEIIPTHRLFMPCEPAALLNRLINAESEDLPQIKLSRNQRVEFMEAILNFLGYHFDAVHSITSINILREVF